MGGRVKWALQATIHPRDGRRSMRSAYVGGRERIGTRDGRGAFLAGGVGYSFKIGYHVSAAPG